VDIKTWNAAIEAAADRCERCGTNWREWRDIYGGGPYYEAWAAGILAEEIRALKKEEKP